MKTRTVLIVDDEPHIAAVIAMKLRRSGLRALTAGNGIEALAILAEQPVDLVIADLRMPGMGGIELCRVMAQDRSLAAVPVIVLTGVGHALDTGVFPTGMVRAIVAKPFSPRDLSALVLQTLGDAGEFQRAA